MTLDVYWLARTAASVPPSDAWLGENELATLRTLRIPKRRADWRLGRWTAKCALAAWAGVTNDPRFLSGIELRPLPTGAPELLIRGRPSGLAVSLSHCNGVGFCALTPAPADLGCDVEQVAPHSAAFLHDYFSVEEQALAAVAAPAEQSSLVTLLWSAKEATLKALQLGLRADTRSVIAEPCACTQDRWQELVTRTGGGRLFRGWWRRTSGLVWTIVADPPPRTPIALGFTSDAARPECTAPYRAQ